MTARHADKVVLMNHGIAAAGTPEEVYRSPAMEQIFGILPDLSSLRAPTEKRTPGEEGTTWN